MSSYLLDTHVLLWWLSAPTQLSAPARAAIRDPGNALIVSAGVVWELAIKRTLGRLEYPDDLLAVLEQEQVAVLPISGRHALAVADLPPLHQDPFDRIQIAQARIEALTLITRDATIKRYDVVTLAA